MAARHDQHPLRLAQPGGERGRTGRVAAADEGEGARLGRDRRERRGVPADPVRDDPPVGGDAPPRPCEQRRAAGGGQGVPGEQIAHGARRDRRVVAAAPELGGRRPGADGPADPQARQTVRLRQPAGDDHPPGPAPRRRRLHAVALDPAVDLVGQHPRAVPLRDGADRRHLGIGQARAGRVVRIADGDQLRAIRHQRAQLVEVGRPAGRGARPLLAQRPGPDDRAESFRQPLHLPVVGPHHHDLVARLDEAPAGDEVRFGPAVGDEDLVLGGDGQGGGDRRAQLRRAVGLGIGERLAGQQAGRVRTEQLADRQRLHAALGQVDLDLVFVERLEPFEREGRDSHGTGSPDSSSALRRRARRGARHRRAGGHRSAAGRAPARSAGDVAHGIAAPADTPTPREEYELEDHARNADGGPMTTGP